MLSEKNDKAQIETISAQLATEISARIGHAETYQTPIEGFEFYRQTKAAETSCACIVEPSIALVVQGKKSMALGDEIFNYDPYKFLITSLDLPAKMQVLEARQDKPYLGLVLKFDLAVISELIVQVPFNRLNTVVTDKSMVLGDTTPVLLDAFKRLIDVMDDEDSRNVIAPMIKREIYWRILISEQGARLRQIVSAGTQGVRIARSIEWLRNHYDEPQKTEDLAQLAQMSKSTFHHHFRELTSMSPLQYQKRLRLMEARRLMLGEDLDASAAAYKVGYESPSQFSREYSRLFGMSPKKDVEAYWKQAG